MTLQCFHIVSSFKIKIKLTIFAKEQIKKKKRRKSPPPPPIVMTCLKTFNKFIYKKTKNKVITVIDVCTSYFQKQIFIITAASFFFHFLHLCMNLSHILSYVSINLSHILSYVSTFFFLQYR